MDNLSGNIKSAQFNQVVPYNKMVDKLLTLDFSSNNISLTKKIIENTSSFSDYINKKLEASGALYGIGGYLENRILYNASEHFNKEPEQRCLHLGVDIWGISGTPVFAPMGGLVHSFAYNHNDRDYGATLILQHQLNGKVFHTLYGHLSLKDIEGFTEGNYIDEGELIAHFGTPDENGNWPPHLHFQIIVDMEMMKGDYPGVCKWSEKEKYMANCPDPDFILKMVNLAVDA